MYGIASAVNRAWRSGTGGISGAGRGGAALIVMRPPCGNAPSGGPAGDAGPPGTARARGQLAPLVTVRDGLVPAGCLAAPVYPSRFAQRTSCAHRVNPELR